MDHSINNLLTIEKEIYQKIPNNLSSNKIPKIVAVSKTFPMNTILPLINHGHNDFGVNKVQETIEKWQSIKSDFNHIKLHMVGKLQKNKVKHAVSIFDYIHSLDNLRLAEKISNEQLKQNKDIKIFIQVNIGKEDSKGGVLASELEEFYKKCIKDFGLNVVGFMCLPPNDSNVSLYFSKMKILINKTDLKELSMGMSNDYLDAIKFGSTYLRIGSKIFGNRNQ